MAGRTLNIHTAQLLVIDMQPRLLAVQHGAQSVELECSRLLRAAQVLAIPVTATTQNATRLGSLCPSIISDLPAGAAIHDKLHFSVIADDAARLTMQNNCRPQVIVCGVETHICVCQTALELLDCGFIPFVVCDAVTARKPESHTMGLQRMADAGVVLTLVESSVYELLGRAGTDEFRALLPLFK